MLVVNFFGAPGAGKSTAALGLAHYLKLRWIDAEYVPEFAKDLVWRESAHLLKHQLYVFAEQQLRIDVLAGKTEVVVSDSPLPLSSFYAPPNYPLSFKQAVFEFFDGYNNVNFFVKRSHCYTRKGRLQTERESDRLSVEMEEFLYQTGVPYYTITASDATPRYLLYWLLQQKRINPVNPAPLGREFIPPKSWKPPVLKVRLGASGQPLRSTQALAKCYIDRDIRTATVSSIKHRRAKKKAD